MIFSIADANSLYCKIEIAEEDRGKTALTSCLCLFRLTRMQFGLKNAREPFLPKMNFLWTKVECQVVLVYLDGIPIFWSTPDGHISRMRQVLTLSCDKGVTLNLKKSELLTN